VSGLKVLPLSSVANTDIALGPICSIAIHRCPLFELATQLELLLLSKLGQSQIPAK
jgi:hypothetical protein